MLFLKSPMRVFKTHRSSSLGLMTRTRITAVSLSPQLHSPAWPSSGTSSVKVSNSAGLSDFRRVENPGNVTYKAKYLAGTVLVPNPSRVEQSEVIKRLPTLLFPFHRALRSITVFITPEFIGWFDEKNAFLGDALHHTYREWFPPARKYNYFRTQRSHRHVVQSRVAVVDRLPFPGGKSSGFPGISVAISKWSGAWLREENQPRRSNEHTIEAPFIAIKTEFQNKDNKEKLLRVLLRPSNTLFMNGRRSTMFIDRWMLPEEAVAEPRFHKSAERMYLDHLTLNHVLRSPSLTLPWTRLTQPREISMCMGNVISKIAGDRLSEPISASLELEEKVTEFMKTSDATDGTLAVFALIMPKAAPKRDLAQGAPLSDDKGTYHEHQAVISTKQETQTHLWHAILNGAHLHRVTSGGGGWGKKQGLLSLDPALDFKPEGPVESPSPSPLEDSDTNTSESQPFWTQKPGQEVAHPGDIIEFYGTYVSREGESALTREESTTTISETPQWRCLSSQSWAHEGTTNFVWGVIPQDSNGPLRSPTNGDNIISLPHHFGMLSEGGIGLQAWGKKVEKQSSKIKGERTTGITRIDVAHAVLNSSIANRVAVPGNDAQHLQSKRALSKRYLGKENQLAKSRTQIGENSGFRITKYPSGAPDGNEFFPRVKGISEAKDK